MPGPDPLDEIIEFHDKIHNNIRDIREGPYSMIKDKLDTPADQLTERELNLRNLADNEEALQKQVKGLIDSIKEYRKVPNKENQKAIDDNYQEVNKLYDSIKDDMEEYHRFISKPANLDEIVKEATEYKAPRGPNYPNPSLDKLEEYRDNLRYLDNNARGFGTSAYSPPVGYFNINRDLIEKSENLIEAINDYNAIDQNDPQTSKRAMKKDLREKAMAVNDRTKEFEDYKTKLGSGSEMASKIPDIRTLSEDATGLSLKNVEAQHAKTYAKLEKKEQKYEAKLDRKEAKAKPEVRAEIDDLDKKKAKAEDMLVTRIRDKHGSIRSDAEVVLKDFNQVVDNYKEALLTGNKRERASAKQDVDDFVESQKGTQFHYGLDVAMRGSAALPQNNPKPVIEKSTTEPQQDIQPEITNTPKMEEPLTPKQKIAKQFEEKYINWNSKLTPEQQEYMVKLEGQKNGLEEQIKKIEENLEAKKITNPEEIKEAQETIDAYREAIGGIENNQKEIIEKNYVTERTLPPKKTITSKEQKEFEIMKIEAEGQPQKLAEMGRTAPSSIDNIKPADESHKADGNYTHWTGQTAEELTTIMDLQAMKERAEDLLITDMKNANGNLKNEAQALYDNYSKVITDYQTVLHDKYTGKQEIETAKSRVENYFNSAEGQLHKGDLRNKLIESHSTATKLTENEYNILRDNEKPIKPLSENGVNEDKLEIIETLTENGINFTDGISKDELNLIKKIGKDQLGLKVKWADVDANEKGADRISVGRHVIATDFKTDKDENLGRG